MGKTQKRRTTITHEATPLGSFVRARREERGLSQQAIGRALGVSHSTIGQLEKKSGYTLATRHFAALSAILDVPMETLLELQGLRRTPGKPTGDQQDAINMVLQMDPEKLQLAKRLLHTLLEDGQKPSRVLRRVQTDESSV